MSDMYMINMFNRKTDLAPRDFFRIAEECFNRSNNKLEHLEFIVDLKLILDFELR